MLNRCILGISIVGLYLSTLYPYVSYPDPNKYYRVTWGIEYVGRDCYISLEDFDLLCHTVYCEAGNQDIEVQKMVAQCIVFRLFSKKFPNNIRDVVYAENGKQFNVVRKPGFPESYPFSDDTEIACFTAITEYPEYSPKMVYFNSKGYFSWAPQYKHKGDMWFSLED